MANPFSLPSWPIKSWQFEIGKLPSFYVDQIRVISCDKFEGFIFCEWNLAVIWLSLIALKSSWNFVSLYKGNLEKRRLITPSFSQSKLEKFSPVTNIFFWLFTSKALPLPVKIKRKKVIVDTWYKFLYSHFLITLFF